MRRYNSKTSIFRNPFRHPFTLLSSFRWNGGGYTIEGKEPRILSRDHNYYFRVRIGDAEGVRSVLEQMSMQDLMESGNRVYSKNGFVVFKIDQEGYGKLKLLSTLVPTGKSNNNHRELNGKDIFEAFKNRNNPPVPHVERHGLSPEALELKRMWGYHLKKDND